MHRSTVHYYCCRVVHAVKSSAYMYDVIAGPAIHVVNRAARTSCRFVRHAYVRPVFGPLQPTFTLIVIHTVLREACFYCSLLQLIFFCSACCESGQMSDVYVPSSMAPVAPPPTCFSSVNLHRRAAGALLAATFAAGAWAATTSAQATAAEDTIIGVRYSADVVDCDEDTIDKITLQLVMWGWRTVKLYTCFRGLRLAAVWFAGTAFSEGLRMRASTLLGRASAAAAAGEVLPGPGGGDASRSRNVTAAAAADS
ncbi:unnamed protein product [Ectocarpus sp. 8 AP-2014]